MQRLPSGCKLIPLHYFVRASALLVAHGMEIYMYISACGKRTQSGPDSTIDKADELRNGVPSI
jgi:hypothetical protein